MALFFHPSFTVSLIFFEAEDKNICTKKKTRAGKVGTRAKKVLIKKHENNIWWILRAKLKTRKINSYSPTFGTRQKNKFEFVYSPLKDGKKNLWRRKCGRRAMIFRTVEVRVEGRFVPFNPYFVCNTAFGSLCDLYGVTLPKKLT